ncbi:MAG: tetratricopeptide repeat protein [Lautropia sp.]|nr:tetratricopeptide repeat protein [Lautropia sp.]
MRHSISLVMLSVLVGACTSLPNEDDIRTPSTVRVCTQGTDCADQPRSRVTTEALAPDTPQQAQEAARMAALEEKAAKEPRAAFDLGLRFFRGDGVQRDSYRAVSWMQKAAEQGQAEAQLALGRLYLSGFEEMGADPAAAESWLSAAARQGNKEAQKLLAEAQKAKQDDAAYRRWVDTYRAAWLDYWWHGYRYHLHWAGAGWYFY